MSLQKCNDNLANCESEKAKIASDCKNQVATLDAESNPNQVKLNRLKSKWKC